MKEIASALVRAQRAFGPALKSSTNPHFRNRYADLSACIEAVIDGLNGSGIAMIQRTFEHTDGVVIETVFIHESGEMLEGGRLFVPASKNDAQGFGSALTYARRYSLMAACGIAPEDDDGNGASRPAPPKPAKPAPAAPAPTPAPTPKAPVSVEGKDTPWQLKVTAEPDGDPKEWAQLIIDATMMQLDHATTEQDVISIFKTNRSIIEHVEKLAPAAYAVLMEQLKQARAKHKKD
jgi:hypothetical protein